MFKDNGSGLERITSNEELINRVRNSISARELRTFSYTDVDEDGFIPGESDYIALNVDPKVTRYANAVINCTFGRTKDGSVAGFSIDARSPTLARQMTDPILVYTADKLGVSGEDIMQSIGMSVDQASQELLSRGDVDADIQRWAYANAYTSEPGIG